MKQQSWIFWWSCTVHAISVFGFNHLYNETTILDSLVILYNPWSLCVPVHQSPSLLSTINPIIGLHRPKIVTLSEIFWSSGRSGNRIYTRKMKRFAVNISLLCCFRCGTKQKLTFDHLAAETLPSNYYYIAWLKVSKLWTKVQMGVPVQTSNQSNQIAKFFWS